MSSTSSLICAPVAIGKLRCEEELPARARPEVQEMRGRAVAPAAARVERPSEDDEGDDARPPGCASRRSRLPRRRRAPRLHSLLSTMSSHQRTSAELLFLGNDDRRLRARARACGSLRTRWRAGQRHAHAQRPSSCSSSMSSTFWAPWGRCRAVGLGGARGDGARRRRPRRAHREAASSAATRARRPPTSTRRSPLPAFARGDGARGVARGRRSTRSRSCAARS